MGEPLELSQGCKIAAYRSALGCTGAMQAGYINPLYSAIVLIENAFSITPDWHTLCGIGLREDRQERKGAGLIDCLYKLARNHIIDGDGRLALSSDPRIVEKDGEVSFVLADAEETEFGGELVVTQPDIQHLIRSKGAVFAARKEISK